MHWVYLCFAIALEVAGTVSMKLSQGFTRLWPSVLMIVFYILAFSSLNLSLKQVPVSVAYAIWSGLGTAAIAVIGYLVFQESMSLLKGVSILLIILGVIGLNVGGQEKPSGSAVHEGSHAVVHSHSGSEFDGDRARTGE
ncbi:multidrug efflux SMR transporter [Paenibacillus melissococcoides]|uniref:Multidrug efflux SMR transporter n=1 Tax=Paenibacillus melissococcoides TaxID=2912268 RepID=A0ABN8U9D3_9BACL|nr:MULTISPECIES: multidrug efflux SMR transporter [Paenibacillus]MEB9892319.1 multidrug efflux SMR transporter [Bacillus cereus]CAH8246696.1 multidrug efflux SMR transporter [Paenibacillus melissococcoides]CAH8715478.1 multidrug efflux SMR transporter [Paenibacillus melissococcoides]CAH8716440.1 multidrug efflux SMR transporter [Paenibacillus melissococcoides]GIO80253.1 QacE family quaternary ammonium compound efflux SMR transporter [Paenibacillus dendritiformis]